MTTRVDIVQIARSYIGTPFHHMGRLPGVGLDCAGVPVCCARELALAPPDFDVPAYTQSPDGHSMIEWCDQYMGGEIAKKDMQAGDMIVLITDKYPQHLGIVANHVSGEFSIVHASTFGGMNRVVEHRLMFSRIQRFSAAYAFPGIA